MKKYCIQQFQKSILKSTKCRDPGRVTISGDIARERIEKYFLDRLKQQFHSLEHVKDKTAIQPTTKVYSSLMEPIKSCVESWAIQA
jgi:hypothetical protein